MKSLLIAALAAFTSMSAAVAQDEAEPRVRGLLFFADWCAKCKVLEPTLAEAIAPYEARGEFELVRLDLTNQRPEAIVGQRLRAREYGAEKAFDRHAPATGLMVIVHGGSGREIATVTSKTTYAGIQSAIDEAIAETR